MAEVKIDKELLERIRKILELGENRFDFPTVKSFVDKAVLKLLKKLEKAKKLNIDLWDEEKFLSILKKK